MRLISAGMALAALAFATGGCSRTGVAELSQEQTRYYRDLRAALEDTSRARELRLEQILTEDLERQKELHRWERDLAKAEIMLRTNGDLDARKRLLMMKLAELDLASQAEYQRLAELGAARKKALMDLYQAVIDATKALEKNNKTINTYLASPDASFAAQSLDVASVVRVVSAVRDVRDELKDVEQRTDEERKKQDERLGKQIDRARDALIKILEPKGT
jgi:hypothetical protein